MKAGFMSQFKQARQDVRQLKKTTPYIFHEWQRLQNAEAAFARAEHELKAARKAWKDF